MAQIREIHRDSNGVTTLSQDEVLGVNYKGHAYSIVNKDGDQLADVRFQMGPVKEVGVNGATNEALLAILIDRTKFLDAQFPCDENKRAIQHMEEALVNFEVRTARRTCAASKGVTSPDP